MKTYMFKWLKLSSIIFCTILLLVLLSGRLGTDILEFVMNPWFNFFSAITPNDWQVRGNILLGLMFLISGLAFYSAILSGIWIAAEVRLKQILTVKSVKDITLE